MRRQMVGRAAVFLEADGTSVLTLAISIAQLARARVPVEADRLTTPEAVNTGPLCGSAMPRLMFLSSMMGVKLN